MTTPGAAAEQLVARQYQAQDYKLLEKNYVFRHGRQLGEIDLIFEKDEEIIFVEVKARSGSKFGGPFEAVDSNKQRRLIKTAKLFLQLHPKFSGYNYRIDVAGVDIDNADKPVIILENAIEDLD